MAKSKNESTEATEEMKPEHKVVLNGVLQAVEQLFRMHFDEIVRHAERENSETLRIGFPVAIEDFQAPERKLKVRMSWSMTMKDGLVCVLPDADQQTFAFISESGERFGELEGNDDE